MNSQPVRENVSLGVYGVEITVVYPEVIDVRKHNKYKTNLEGTTRSGTNPCVRPDISLQAALQSHP